MARRQKKRPSGGRRRESSPQRLRHSRADLEHALEQAHRLLEQEQTYAAIELLSPFLETHRREPELHNALGYAYARLGQVWDALDAYEQALRLSRDPAFYIPLANLYTTLEFRAHSLRAFERVLQLQDADAFRESALQVLPMLRQEIADLAHDLNLPATRAEDGLYEMEDGQLALQRGDYGASVAASRRAIRYLGDWPPPHNNLALALFQNGQHQEAIAAAGRVLTTEPDNIHALSNSVRFLAWTGRQAEAETLWARLETVEPENADLLLKAAEAAAVLAKDEAVHRLLSGLDRAGWDDETQPDLAARGQFFLAVALANLGRPDAAKRLRALQATFPQVVPMLDALKVRKPGPGWASRFPYYAGVELLPAAQFDAFVRLVGQKDALGERRFKREIDRFVDRFPQLVLIAEQLIWEEEQAEVGLSILRLLDTPMAYAALRRFGFSQAGSDGQRIQALGALSDAGQIAPDVPQRVWLQGQWQEIALRQYEISDEPDSVYTPDVADVLNEALALLQQGDDRQAERLFRRAIKIEPRAKEAYNNLAVIYARRDEHARARDMFQKAVAIDSHYVLPRCNLALYLLGDDDVDGAEAMIAPLAEVTRFQPQNMAMYAYTQARIFLLRDQDDAAREALAMALELVPDHALSRDLLDRLDEISRLRKGFASIFARMRQRAKSKRARMQEKLTTPEPGLSQVLETYTKDALTGMARQVLPWGGWSALRKAELIERLVDALCDADRLANVTEGLDTTAREALRTLLEAGGMMPWDDFDARYGNDLDESPYWNYHVPETTMGQLRLRGLLVETTVDGVAQVAVPVELRSLFAQGPGELQR